MLSPLPGWIVYDEVDLYAQPTVHDGYIYVYYTAPPLVGFLGLYTTRVDPSRISGRWSGSSNS